MKAWRWAFGAAAAALVVVACAQGQVTVEDDGSTNSSSAAVGGSGQGGVGGAGGEVVALPCGIDCGTISTPDCKVAICDEALAQCVVVNDEEGTACDDGLFCTVNDACIAGQCTGGPPNDCGVAAMECHEITCDETAKTCSQVAALDGDPCVAADLCLANTTCFGGTCQGQLKDCFFAPVPNDCYVAVCNPANGICEPVPGNTGQPCTDLSDLCTVNKVCDDAGVCGQGNPKDCSALTQGCVNGVCDVATGQCYADPIMPGMQCAAATDDCNTGICDMNGLCIGNAANEGGVCDDGLTCTTATTCTAGICGGGMSTINIYFAEDFSSNAAGWTLGPEWQIGPTMMSPPSGACGLGDPATDHSSSADNGIAGVVIGGNASTTLHPLAYITSPAIDTSTVAGPLILSYHRWLHSDYTPFMQNQVEVFNGTSWVVLWQSGPSPGVQDATWMPQSHDITAYKATNMQVRFGFDVGSSGVYTCSGWNLDDVLLASGSCN